TQLQTELEATQTQLGEGRRESTTLGREVNQLQQRLADTKQTLTSELTRLEEVQQAADSAERHAKEVRARVQREAKRVADLAAAAVMAAAAGGGDTGEYRMVPAPGSPAAEAAADAAEAVVEAAAEAAAEIQAVIEEDDEPAPRHQNGHPRHDGVPGQR